MAHTSPDYRAGFNDALDAIEAAINDKADIPTLVELITALRKAEPRHLLGIDPE